MPGPGAPSPCPTQPLPPHPPGAPCPPPPNTSTSQLALMPALPNRATLQTPYLPPSSGIIRDCESPKPHLRNSVSILSKFLTPLPPQLPHNVRCTIAVAASPDGASNLPLRPGSREQNPLNSSRSPFAAVSLQQTSIKPLIPAPSPPPLLPSPTGTMFATSHGDHTIR